MGLANFHDGIMGEFDVSVTVSLPESHRAIRLFRDPSPQIFVWHKEQIPILWRGFYDFFGVATRANDIAQGFDFGTAIDVGDRIKVRISLLKCSEAICWATLL